MLIFFKISPEVANLSENATGIVRFSKRYENGFCFKKRIVSRKKTQVLLKIAKGSKSAKESDWNGRNSRNLQKLKFLWKIDRNLEKKLERFENTETLQNCCRM